MNSVQNSMYTQILDVLEACKPVIRHIASSYHVDADDLLQDVALFALEHPQKCTTNPSAYYPMKARYLAIDRASRDISLNAPVSPDDTKTLADELPSAPIGIEEDHSTADTRAEALYAALSKLPLDEQEYLCSVHKLTAYTPTDTGVQIIPRFRRSGPRSKPTIQVSSYYHIRKDQELLHAIQEASRSQSSAPSA